MYRTTHILQNIKLPIFQSNLKKKVVRKFCKVFDKIYIEIFKSLIKQFFLNHPNWKWLQIWPLETMRIF